MRLSHREAFGGRNTYGFLRGDGKRVVAIRHLDVVGTVSVDVAVPLTNTGSLHAYSLGRDHLFTSSAS